MYSSFTPYSSPFWLESQLGTAQPIIIREDGDNDWLTPLLTAGAIGAGFYLSDPERKKVLLEGLRGVQDDVVDSVVRSQGTKRFPELGHGEKVFSADRFDPKGVYTATAEERRVGTTPRRNDGRTAGRRQRKERAPRRRQQQVRKPVQDVILDEQEFIPAVLGTSVYPDSKGVFVEEVREPNRYKTMAMPDPTVGKDYFYLIENLPPMEPTPSSSNRFVNESGRIRDEKEWLIDRGNRVLGDWQPLDEKLREYTILVDDLESYNMGRRAQKQFTPWSQLPLRLREEGIFPAEVNEQQFAFDNQLGVTARDFPANEFGLATSKRSSSLIPESALISGEKVANDSMFGTTLYDRMQQARSGLEYVPVEEKNLTIERRYVPLHLQQYGDELVLIRDGELYAHGPSKKMAEILREDGYMLARDKDGNIPPQRIVAEELVHGGKVLSSLPERVRLAQNLGLKVSDLPDNEGLARLIAFDGFDNYADSLRQVGRKDSRYLRYQAAAEKLKPSKLQTAFVSMGALEHLDDPQVQTLLDQIIAENPKADLVAMGIPETSDFVGKTIYGRDGTQYLVADRRLNLGDMVQKIPEPNRFRYTQSGQVQTLPDYRDYKMSRLFPDHSWLRNQGYTGIEYLVSDDQDMGLGGRSTKVVTRTAPLNSMDVGNILFDGRMVEPEELDKVTPVELIRQDRQAFIGPVQPDTRPVRVPNSANFRRDMNRLMDYDIVGMGDLEHLRDTQNYVRGRYGEFTPEDAGLIKQWADLADKVEQGHKKRVDDDFDQFQQRVKMLEQGLPLDDDEFPFERTFPQEFDKFNKMSAAVEGMVHDGAGDYAMAVNDMIDFPRLDPGKIANRVRVGEAWNVLPEVPLVQPTTELGETWFQFTDPAQGAVRGKTTEAQRALDPRRLSDVARPVLVEPSLRGVVERPITRQELESSLTRLVENFVPLRKGSYNPKFKPLPVKRRTRKK